MTVPHWYREATIWSFAARTWDGLESAGRYRPKCRWYGPCWRPAGAATTGTLDMLALVLTMPTRSIDDASGRVEAWTKGAPTLDLQPPSADHCAIRTHLVSPGSRGFLARDLRLCGSVSPPRDRVHGPADLAAEPVVLPGGRDFD